MYILQIKEKYILKKAKMDNPEELVMRNGNNYGIRVLMNSKSSQSLFWTTQLKLILQFLSEVLHIFTVALEIWANER